VVPRRKNKDSAPREIRYSQETQKAHDLGRLDGQNHFAAGQLLAGLQGDPTFAHGLNFAVESKAIGLDQAADLLRNSFHAQGGNADITHRKHAENISEHAAGNLKKALAPTIPLPTN